MKILIHRKLFSDTKSVLYAIGGNRNQSATKITSLFKMNKSRKLYKKRKALRQKRAGRIITQNAKAHLKYRREKKFSLRGNAVTKICEMLVNGQFRLGWK